MDYLNIKYPYIEFDDGSKYNIKYYNKNFINMAISRPSCSSCQFRNINRFSEFIDNVNNIYIIIILFIYFI